MLPLKCQPPPKKKTILIGEIREICARDIRCQPPRDPGSPSENGFMEPKYDLRFVSVMGSTPCSSSDVR